MHPYDILEAINELTEEEKCSFAASGRRTARIVAFMEPEEAADVMEDLDFEAQRIS